MGPQVMVGQQTPGLGGTEAVSFSPVGQLGHGIIYRKERAKACLVIPPPKITCTRTANELYMCLGELTLQFLLPSEAQELKWEWDTNSRWQFVHQ